MTTSALIDKIINFSDNTDANDADNANRRLRILQYCQEVVDEIWQYRQWPFRIASPGTVTITAGNTSGDLPVDFDFIADQCGVYEQSSGRQLIELSQQEILIERFQTNRLYDGFIYSIFGFNGTTNRKLIQIGPSRTDNWPLTVMYVKTSPALVDANNSTGMLEQIPAQYHNTVILPGVVAKTKTSLGDERDWTSQFLKGLGQMVHNERPRRAMVRRLPLQRGMW